MKIIIRSLMLVFGLLVLVGCSDEMETQVKNEIKEKSSNFIVSDKAMQTIQDAKNVDALLQKSADQRSKELDKY